MTLTKYNRRPNGDIMSKRFSDIMDEFFNDVVSTRRDSFVPGIDISETENEYRITAELPGMKKEDISVDLENGRLSISGERSFEKEDEGETYHRVESQYGSFNRSFKLPENVDEETIDAKYEDGLLRITIEKQEDKVKKQIDIK